MVLNCFSKIANDWFSAGNVTCIGKYAFWSCKPTSITIPEGVKTLGEAAFYNCKSLDTVHFNAINCKTTGSYPVFRDCSSLTTFEIGENVETIPAVLQNCSSISTITIPASVRIIGDNAFQSCTNLTVDIPEGITSIGKSAFFQCSGLTSITIPEGVTSIGQSAFFGCSGLTTVNLNATNCTSIGNYNNPAFKNCSQLTTVNIGDNVAAIPDYAFYGCTGLTDINFGSSVRSIGSAAFGNCTSLTSVTVPDEITTIGNSAFQSVKNVIYHGNATGSPWDALNVNATIDGDFIYADAEKTKLAAYIGSGGSVVIPDAVTTIGNSAFHSCTGLTSITFGSSVTTIGSTAFGGCTGLTEVTVPNTVTSIGNGAFAGCSSLQSITLPFVGDKPHQPTDIYQYPLGYIFGGNGTQITQSYIGSSPNELTFNYFKIPSSLESVTITDCNYIAPYALSNLTMLKSLTIPETVTTIGNNAFNGCSNLQTLTYNTNAITTQFKNFYYLKTVNIGNTVTAISDEAFSGCENLRSVVIPNSVESIGSNAFYRTALQGTKADGDNLYYLGNSENLYLCLYKAESTDIATCAINSGCKLIYDNALANCTALTEITVSDGVTSIGQNAFLNIKNIIYHGTATGSPWGALMVNGTIDGDFIYADAEKTIIAAYIGSGSSVVIPDAVTTIGNSAFSSCTGLTEVTFGSNCSLTTIGENAFKGCTGLTSITVPNTVTSIGSSAFGGCSGLLSISLPFVGDQQHQPTDACQYPLGYIFGSDSYEGGTETWQSYTGSPWNGTKYYIPTSLASVAITNGSRIPNGAFYNCRNITSVSLPNTLESIDANAFYYCDNLASVNIPGGVTSIGGNAFFNCKVLTTVNIPDGVTSIDYCAFRWCSSLTTVNIPDNCTTIDASAFESCTSLTSITIPDAVTAIGNSAFSGCTGLASLTVPNTVETIGSNAFYKIPKVFYAGNAEGCPWGALKVVGVIDGDFVYSDAAKTNLVEYAGEGGAVTIPETVRSIDNNAFEGCTGLTAVTFNSGITTIGKNAFEGCTGLTQVNIPEGAETIDNYAFKNCTGLTSVVIPKSVTSVGIGAFSGCSSLESITLPFVGNTPKQPDDAYQYPFGYIFGYNSYEGGRSVTQKWYQSYIGDIQNYSCYIPETLREVNVTNCSHLTAYAFYGCSMLTTITLPNTLESVGLWAFPSGNGFPCSLQRKEENGVKYLGNSENEYLLLESAATDITECEISSRCKIINWAAFIDCTNLSSIEIPSSVTYIGEYAFSGCTGLTSVVVPQSVKSIGTGAFKGCSSLEAITLPFVGEKQYLPSDEYQYAFGHIFGEQGYTDGMCINQYCAPQSNWQKYYYIPSTLRSVTITGSNYISYGAFSNCSMLTTINIPNTVENIGERAFYGCTALQTYTEDEYANYLGNSENHFVCLYQAKSTDMAAFQIHSGCNVVYHDALSGCGSLAAIIIPETVACVGQQAFMNCSSATIYCEAEQKPDNWYANWNRSNRPVEWGCKAIKVAVDNADWGTAVATGHAVVAPDGSQWFKNNAEMTLTATPIIGYHFVKWTEDGNEESNRTFVPAHSGTYTAEFSDTPFNIIYMVDGEEYQKVEGIAYNASISLIDEPTARHGYTFSGWSELPETMPAHDVTVEGSFIANLHKITYLVDEEEYQVIENVAYSTALSPIDEPTLVGHTFSGWSTLPETMPDEDVTIEGTFSINSYNISVGGENGTVTGGGVYVFNTTATLEASASTGYHFVKWTDGVTDNPRTVIVKSDSTFTASFAAHVDSVVFENVAAATCIVAGSYDSVVYCLICKEELGRKKVDVKATGHKADSVAFENAVAATCSAAGSYDSVVYCSVCKIELSRKKVDVAAAGHKADSVAFENTVAATCSAAGSVDSVVYCTVCKAEISRKTVEIPVIPHTAGEAVAENLKAATCTAAGSVDSVVYCTVCKAELSRKTVEIPVIPHTAGEAVAENLKVATCTAAGSVDSVVYCTVCKAELSRKTVEIPVIPHTLDKAVNLTEATCTEAGLVDTVIYCTVCKAEISHSKNEIFAKGHDVVVDAVVAATCTESGKTGGSHCSVCGEVIVAQTEIPALGHKFVNYIYNNDATTEADGTETATCEHVCGATDTRTAVGTKLESTVAISESAADNLVVYAHGNTIVVENAEDDIYVYDAMGRLIGMDAANCVRAEIHVNGAGVYIVKTGNTAKRVMIND